MRAHPFSRTSSFEVSTGTNRTSSPNSDQTADSDFPPDAACEGEGSRFLPLARTRPRVSSTASPQRAVGTPVESLLQSSTAQSPRAESPWRAVGSRSPLSDAWTSCVLHTIACALNAASSEIPGPGSSESRYESSPAITETSTPPSLMDFATSTDPGTAQPSTSSPASPSRGTNVTGDPTSSDTPRPSGCAATGRGTWTHAGASRKRTVQILTDRITSQRGRMRGPDVQPPRGTSREPDSHRPPGLRPLRHPGSRRLGQRRLLPALQP
ncbi:MAG: hypothetical protein DYH08_18515 [Actinobacteria bacterium ATB1]|nr:hypothetical protein [Actinobacteria bacterium ATB1]